MLTKLFIQNYALIRHLKIEPSGHLNIITGETGAGKSIMIGAVGLLLGNRADTKSLYNSDQKCIVEGIFDIGEYQLNTFFEENDLDYNRETIIRREISPAGKSRAFINDTPVTLEVMRMLGSYLMDVHSQHDTLLLGSLNYQLSVVDTFAQNNFLQNEYYKAFLDFQNRKKELEILESEAAQLKKESDFNQFLFDELNSAKLIPDEQEELEETLNKLEHAEEIKTSIFEAIHLLQDNDGSAIELIGNIHRKIENLSSYSHVFQEFNDRLNNIFLELKDLAREIEKESNSVEHNPQLASEINERLSLIYKLQQKHQVSEIKELITIMNELAIKVERNISLDSEIEVTKKRLAKTIDVVNDLGEKLSKSRSDQFSAIKATLEEMLKNLGIPEARIQVDHKRIDPEITGTDEIELLFSANKGVAPMNLKAVASGGEFSRLMFCIKFMIAGKKALPTLILDEIDTGISGEIALKMARMMKEMAKNHQVVAITHLPQIASSGSKHYFVYKESTSEKSVSLIRELGKDERIVEIAKMIGGDRPSIAAMDNARELLSGLFTSPSRIFKYVGRSARPVITSQPTRSPQVWSCSTAASRKVSPAPRITELPSCW